LNDLSGNPHTLSEYRGKVVVIDFFGAQCGYCKSDAIDNLVPLYNTYYKNDAKVQFLGVEVDDYSAAAIQQYYQQPTGVSWPLLVNGGNVFSTYQASSTPTLYVISPAGNIAFSSTYPTNAQTVRSTIDALEGTTTLSAPAHLFVQGTDQALWTKYYQSASGWSGWQSLGGSLTSSPAAATAPGSSSIDVFARRHRRRRLVQGLEWRGNGLAGTLSVGRFLPAQDLRPAHGAQVVSTSLYKVRMAPCIKSVERLVVVQLDLSWRVPNLVTSSSYSAG